MERGNDKDKDLSALVKSQATYHEAPDELRTRIAAQFAQESRLAASKMPRAPVRKSGWWGRMNAATASDGARWWGLGGAFSAGAILATVGMLMLGAVGQQSALSDQVVDSHIRSMMASHLSDVLSSDQHTVKPWFDGKLPFSPPVRDLAAQGYPLVGGRLDYINGQPVAALVYRHRLHVINVFVWPAKSSNRLANVSTSKQGFNVESWQVNGMECWAVSDVEAASLHAFAQLLRASE